MKNWISGRQKSIRKTVSSHQKDNVRNDDGMTTSSHTRDTAGGGHGIFLERKRSCANDHFATEAHSNHGQ